MEKWLIYNIVLYQCTLLVGAAPAALCFQYGAPTGLTMLCVLASPGIWLSLASSIRKGYPKVFNPQPGSKNKSGPGA